MPRALIFSGSFFMQPILRISLRGPQEHLRQMGRHGGTADGPGDPLTSLQKGRWRVNSAEAECGMPLA